MCKEMDIEELLTSVYYDASHPASFSGSQKLYVAVKSKGITLRQVKEFLKKQETYTLHFPVKRKFQRNKVFSPRIDHQWDADLMDMQQISTYNEGYNYVLLSIDIFSRFVWTVPLKSKKGNEVIRAFETIFSQGRKPKYLRTDKGTEFLNFNTKSFFGKHGVKHFVTQNEEIKANYAERAIKTIKMKIYKYFTANQTNTYINTLKDITSAYNNSVHRTIKTAPIDVTKETENEVFTIQYAGAPIGKSRHYKYKVGDFVRISHKKKPFSREYHEKWSGELFEIKTRLMREGIPLYQLSDYQKEDIIGTFYEEELQAVIPGEVFKVEKILKTRKRKGRPKEYFVHWLRWPSKYDSWISEKDFSK